MSISELIARLRELEANVRGDGYWVEDEAAVVMDALPLLLSALEKAVGALNKLSDICDITHPCCASDAESTARQCLAEIDEMVKNK